MKNNANNNADIDNRIQDLTKIIKQNPFDHQQNYIQRSEQFELKKDYNEAILDLSRSMCIYPSLEAYVKRGKLYASSQFYEQALEDFQQANRLYKLEKIQQSKGQKLQQHEKNQQSTKLKQQAIVFLQKSVTIAKLPELKKVARVYQKSKEFMPIELNNQFKMLMNRLIQQKFQAQLNVIKKQNQDYQKLMNLVKQQNQKIKQLQQGLNDRPIDYQIIFEREIIDSTMSQANKNKCTTYYNSVISIMEKYYLSAKVLDKFEQKISFEDYEQFSKQKQRYSFSKKMLQKLFKIFDKNQQHLQKAAQILKQIPYIGTAFKLIKPIFKICGWVEQAKMQSQCENILAVRSSVSSFNSASSRIAYQMYKYFKLNITSQDKLLGKSEIYKKNCLQKVGKLFQKFKRNNLAAKIYQQVKQAQSSYAQQMGSVHASILMTGVAYGIINIPTDLDSLTEQYWRNNIFQKIQTVQQKLSSCPATEQQQMHKETANGYNKMCNIF